jgi:hypothetical protein
LVGELQSQGAVQVDDRELMAKIAAVEAAFRRRTREVAVPSVPQARTADAEDATEAETRPPLPRRPPAIEELPIGESIELEAILEAGMVEAPLVPQTALPVPDAEPAEAGTAPATESDLMVGGVRISPSLYRILLEETAQHLATLDHELRRSSSIRRPIRPMRWYAPRTPDRNTSHPVPAGGRHGPCAGKRAAVAAASCRASGWGRACPRGWRGGAVAELVDFVGMRKPFDAAALERAGQAAGQARRIAAKPVAIWRRTARRCGAGGAGG